MKYPLILPSPHSPQGMGRSHLCLQQQSLLPPQGKSSRLRVSPLSQAVCPPQRPRRQRPPLGIVSDRELGAAFARRWRKGLPPKAKVVVATLEASSRARAPVLLSLFPCRHSRRLGSLLTTFFGVPSLAALRRRYGRNGSPTLSSVRGLRSRLWVPL